jgi:archaeal flagellar protein FlaJ
MNEGLKRNVEAEINMLKEISTYFNKLSLANIAERKLLMGAIESLRAGIKIINSSIPRMLRDTSFGKKLPTSQEKKTSTRLENVTYRKESSELDVVIDSKDKERFLRELSISEKYIKRLKKGEKLGKGEEFREFQASRGYLRLANQLFLNLAIKSVKKGKFKSLSVGLKKGNIEILFESYIAMMYFTVLLSFIFSFILAVFLFFFQIGFSSPFIDFYQGSYLLRLAKIFWIPLAVPFATYLAVYYYPSSEKQSIGYKINQELPFAVIHMSAISGSGIEPSEIFKIVGLSKEYPSLRREIRKVLNQINLYGYDLVTAVNNASRSAPSEKLAELFSGLSTTITSGASLQNFLEKRAESLLLEYRLEREKYTRLIETFLDIYISVVIAAPMVFLLLMILISISGVQVGYSSFQLSVISVVGIALLNIFFLAFLQVKQPPY